MAKQIEIGSSALDRAIYTIQLEGENLTDEEVMAEIKDFEDEFGEVETPRLMPDKFTYLDFIIDGKPHPKTDEILAWVSEMVQNGKSNQIPDKVKDAIALYEKTH